MSKREKVKYVSIILLLILVLTLAIIILTNTIANDIIARPTLYPMPQDPVPMPPHKAPIPVGQVISCVLICGSIITITFIVLINTINTIRNNH